MIFLTKVNIYYLKSEKEAAVMKYSRKAKNYQNMPMDRK
jgi:hypothetical protein